MRLNESQKKVRRELRSAALRHGIPPDILDTLGYVESPAGHPWKLGTRSTHPADEALGGAWGPTQITEKTARLNGYDGSMDTLANDAWLSAEWTARLLKVGAKNAEGKVLRQTPKNMKDAATWWNAGRQSYSDLAPTHVTRRVYVPRALAVLDLVKRNPVV